MDIINPLQNAAANRLGGSTVWQDAMKPQMPDFGAMPDISAMPPAQSEPAAASPAPSSDPMVAQFLEGRKSGKYDENGLRKDGKMFRGPKARLFVAQNGGKDIVLKDKNLAAQLNQITIAENREIGGLPPLEQATPQTFTESKPLPFDQAAKLSAIKSSYDQIQDLADSLFDPETGEFKRGDAAKAKLPGTAEARYNLKGQQALETWLRAMTGAAVTEDEMNRYIKMYLPQPWDDADVALDKLDRLQKLYTGTLENMGRKGDMDVENSRVASTKKRRDAAQKAAAQTADGTPPLTAGRGEGTPGFNAPQKSQGERPALESFWR